MECTFVCMGNTYNIIVSLWNAQYRTSFKDFGFIQSYMEEIQCFRKYIGLKLVLSMPKEMKSEQSPTLKVSLLLRPSSFSLLPGHNKTASSNPIPCARFHWILQMCILSYRPEFNFKGLVVVVTIIILTSLRSQQNANMEPKYLAHASTESYKCVYIDQLLYLKKLPKHHRITTTLSV